MEKHPSNDRNDKQTAVAFAQVPTKQARNAKVQVQRYEGQAKSGIEIPCLPFHAGKLQSEKKNLSPTQ